MSYNKYYIQKRQVSYDNGLTWSDVIPMVTRTGDYIGTYQTLADCNGTVDYSGHYFTLVSKSDNNSISFTRNTIQYSLDDGSTWSSLTTGHSVTVDYNETVMFRASGLPVNATFGIGSFASTGLYEARGNAMSLKYGENFSGQTAIDVSQFKRLFYNSSGLTSAEYLVLPSTSLARECYVQMFYNCTRLTSAPKLPATTLAIYCYENMFYGCTQLVSAPTLSATTLADNCYADMFNNCSGLTSAPELPATTLADGCYGQMFYGCRSLTTAPELPAATLTDYCYYRMFAACTSLNYIKCLATDISASSCTNRWLSEVSSTGTFIKASTMTSWTTGNNGIPSNWTVVDNS